MPDHTAARFRNQRYHEGLGGAKRLDNELFGVVTDRQGLKRGDRHLGDGSDVVVRPLPAMESGARAGSPR